jgi:glycerophosphoryl diester phosphodiesterase
MEIIAHRGASHDAPENTLAAAQLAWEQGADALEMDIRLTADRQLAVIHDETTRRVAGMAMAISNATSDELAELDVGSWKNPRYANEKIPLLGEMLANVPAQKRVFIELKGGPEVVAALKHCVADSSLTSNQIVVIAFDFAAVQAAKKALPDHAVAWILDYAAADQVLTIDDIAARCAAAGLDGMDLNVRWPIDANVVKRVHRAGLKLYVWTVDDPAVAKQLAAAGVDGIATNRPGWLRGQITV